MENIKRIAQWLYYSSKDMNKVSTTVKSFLVGLATFATFALGLQDIALDQNLVTQAIDAIIAVVQSFGVLISALGVAYGMIRKVIVTAKGQHPMGSVIR